MPAEVYSTAKPAAPFRAWIVALFLLILASALAADLVHRGSGGWTAGERTQPEGWDLTFQIPRQFSEVHPDPRVSGSIYFFHHTDKLGRLVEISLWRKAMDGGSAVQLARFLIEKSKSWFTLPFGPPATRAVGRLGDREALEIHDGSIPMVLRTIVLPNGWGYAVCMRVEGGPIDESLYGLFDMTCRGVRIQTSEK